MKCELSITFFQLVIWSSQTDESVIISPDVSIQGRGVSFPSTQKVAISKTVQFSMFRLHLSLQIANNSPNIVGNGFYKQGKEEGVLCGLLNYRTPISMYVDIVKFQEHPLLLADP